jgi:transposase
LTAVLLGVEGRSIPAIARLLHKSFQVVYRWVFLYLKTHRIEALFDAPKSGRPLSAPGIFDRRLFTGVETLVLWTWATTVWTVKMLAQHLNAHYGTQMHPRTLYRRMKAMGLRCKRPRYIYEEKEPSRIQKKGRASHRGHPGPQRPRGALGNPQYPGHRIVMLATKMSGFRNFLRLLHRHYPGRRPLYRLLDKGNIHISPLSQALAKELNTELVWLPKQCPELNGSFV